MVYITFGLVSFFASVIGSICGIGGGVIIKPTLDAFQIYSAATISLMCGCTVLAMAACSICRILISETSYIRWKVSGWLGAGAATGGIIGGRITKLHFIANGTTKSCGSNPGSCAVRYSCSHTVVYAERE